MSFVKARKSQAKLRLAIIGPAGYGKTYSALRIARGLAGPAGKIAVLDSEHGSASKYADRFEFDVLAEPWGEFSPAEYRRRLRLAEEAGYDVIIVDSLSHAWAGAGGALEMVDAAAARSRSGNSFAAWRDVTPEHNKLVEAMLACRAHLIVTMRAKTEWVLEENDRGKKEPRKVGLQPVQREGLDYEFDVVGDVDAAHRFIVSKTRYSALFRKVVEEPSEELGAELGRWLSDGAPAPSPTPAPSNGSNGGTRQAPASAADPRRARAVARLRAATEVLGAEECRRLVGSPRSLEELEEAAAVLEHEIAIVREGEADELAADLPWSSPDPEPAAAAPRSPPAPPARGPEPEASARPVELGRLMLAISKSGLAQAEVARLLGGRKAHAIPAAERATVLAAIEAVSVREGVVQ